MEITEARQTLEVEVRSYVSSLQIQVKDAESCIVASEVLKEIKRRMKVIDDRLEPSKKKAYGVYQDWNDLIKELKAPYLEKEVYIKKQLSDYDREQERIRREEEARLREEARKREEEAQIQAAIEADNKGEKEEAEAILEEKPYVPPIVLPKTTPKVEGISYRENWTFRIVDAAKVPREYLKVDEVKIGGVVRSMKGGTKIAGVEIYSERVVAAGRR
jgi:hypothetical protein